MPLSIRSAASQITPILGQLYTSSHSSPWLKPTPTHILSVRQDPKPLCRRSPNPLPHSYFKSSASSLLTQRLLNITLICRKYAKTVYVWKLKYMKLSHQAILCFSKRYMLRPAGLK